MSATGSSGNENRHSCRLPQARNNRHPIRLVVEPGKSGLGFNTESLLKKIVIGNWCASAPGELDVADQLKTGKRKQNEQKQKDCFRPLAVI